MCFWCNNTSSSSSWSLVMMMIIIIMIVIRIIMIMILVLIMLIVIIIMITALIIRMITLLRIILFQGGQWWSTLGKQKKKPLQHKNGKLVASRLDCILRKTSIIIWRDYGLRRPDPSLLVGISRRAIEVVTPPRSSSLKRKNKINMKPWRRYDQYYVCTVLLPTGEEGFRICCCSSVFWCFCFLFHGSKCFCYIFNVNVDRNFSFDCRF